MGQEWLAFARQTAQAAGRILMKHFGRIERIEYKAMDSIVTEADIRAESAIRRAIRRTHPQHRVLGEEEGLDAGRAEYTWVVDPLDGTTNFAAGVPLFAVSLALFRHREPILGVVYDPVRKDVYHATPEGPAMLNGEPIGVSRRRLTPTTLAAFGSSWNSPGAQQIPSRIIERFKGRNLGSTVLHLTSVATGRMEFAVAQGTKLWDVAAAGFIVERAGGRVTDLEGRRVFPLKRSFKHYLENNLDFLASNALVHHQVLREIIQPD